jgi:chondroitin-sulfate-ABC endolyase/exolyase
MQRFAAEPPYRVLQRDQAAHIVWDSAGRRWGCVFFAPQEVVSHTVATEALPVKAVDRPCLVMADAVRDGHLDATVADPDLNLDKGVSQPRPLRVTFRGPWRPLDAPSNVRILSANAAETVVEILCQHGASYALRLTRP